MDLIDTHQHLIYRDRFGYDWADGIPPLAKGDYTVEDYGALAGDAVTGTLFMEAAVNDADYKDEARFVAGLVGSHGMLGQIASCRPEDDAGFTEWLDECAGLSVVGFRRVLHVVPDEMSTTATFRANVAEMGRRGFPFDICVLARQLPLAIELAKAAPGTMMVLDHCGVPDIAGGGLDPWRAHISEIAALDNLVCKVSGLTAYCAPDTDRAQAIAPYVDHAISAFGTDRVVWGGDWPVVDLGSGLPDWIAITGRMLAALGEADARAIASENARRVWNLA